MLKLGTLRNKIIAWSFVPTAIILAAVALVAYGAYQQVTAEMVVERNQELARLSAGQIAGELTEYTDDLSGLARSLSVYAGSSGGLRQMLAALANRVAIFDGGVVLTDDHGYVVAAQPPRPEIIGDDWSGRSYFQQLLRSSEPVMSDMVPHGPDGSPVIVMAVPITGDGGEFLGMAAGMFRIGPEVSNSFYGSIVKLRLMADDVTYLVDSTGRVLYHADDRRIGEDFSRQDAVRLVTLGKVGAERGKSVSGQDIIASYAPVPASPWGFVIESDWRSLLSASRNYSEILLVLLGLGLLIPAIFSAVGSGRIVKPIQELAIAAQQVAGGNFGQTVEANTGDEVEELVTQFNRMSAELLDSYTALREREERLGLVIQGTYDGIWDWQIESNQVYFSPRWKAMLGFEDGELANEFATWLALMHPDDHEGVQQMLQDYLDNKTPVYAVEHRLRHKDGGYRWILSRGIALRYADGKPYRLAGSHTDITELKRAQGILAGQREFLELLATGRSFCDTLDALVRSIEEQLTGLRGMVRLLDTPQGQQANCASAPSLPDEFIEALDALKTGDAPDMCGSLLSEQPTIVEDIASDDRWAAMRELALKHGLRACWAEPIRAPDGRSVGAFVLYADRPRLPDLTEAGVMETAARLVGVARAQEQSQQDVQRAYQTLERRVEERTRELATLNAVAAVANQSLDLRQILQSALEETMDALHLEAGAAFRLDERNRGLLAVVARGLSEDLAERIEVLSLDSLLAGRPLVLDGLYVFGLKDYPPGDLRDLIEDEGLDLLVGVPLASSGQLVGFLLLSTRTERALTADEKSLLRSVGQQVGVAIENANLYSAEQRRREVAEGLRETLNVLNSRQSLPETLKHIVEQAQRLMGSDAVALMRMDNGRGSLVVQASKGLPDDFASALTVPVGSAASGRAIAERRPVAVSDTTRLYEQILQQEAHPGGVPDHILQRTLALFRAMLSVPLIILDEPYGAITLYYSEAREFSDEDLRQGGAVADQAALALESARLRDQAGITAAVEERTRLARELHDSVTQSLYSVTLYAEAAARLMESGSASAAAQHLRDVRDTTLEALREMRLLIFQLRPPKLEEIGLASALQARLQSVEERGGLDAELKVTGQEWARRVPLSVQADLYAIVQEALNNCLKHSQATKVWVELEFLEGSTSAVVRDDGIGFDVEEGLQAGGIGLQSMRERVDRLGGALTIESTPGAGARISVEVRHGGA